MAMKPLTTTRPRDLAGTTEPVGSAPAVSSIKGVESPGEHHGPAERQHGDGRTPRRPREERELDEQRRALARMILGVFEPAGSPADGASGAPAGGQGGEPRRGPDGEHSDGGSPAAGDVASAPPATRNVLLDQAIVEFMYALFHALDQIDDAEPTLAHRALAASGAASGGRSAFGERVDLLANRLLAAADATPGAAGRAVSGGLSTRLARAYEAVLRAIHSERAGAAVDPRPELAALLRRLANALHVAPTLGYATSSTAGALLRVTA
jgi:hypothetical protein